MSFVWLSVHVASTSYVTSYVPASQLIFDKKHDTKTDRNTHKMAGFHQYVYYFQAKFAGIYFVSTVSYPSLLCATQRNLTFLAKDRMWPKAVEVVRKTRTHVLTLAYLCCEHSIYNSEARQWCRFTYRDLWILMLVELKHWLTQLSPYFASIALIWRQLQYIILFFLLLHF